MSKLEERLVTLRDNFSDSNCVGTALFLVGELDSDSFVSPLDAHKYFGILKKERTPNVGHIVAWYNLTYDWDEAPIHVAVVSKLEPLSIIHRMGRGRVVYVNEPIVQVDARYGKKRSRNSKDVNFYIPKVPLTAEDLEVLASLPIDVPLVPES